MGGHAFDDAESNARPKSSRAEKKSLLNDPPDQSAISSTRGRSHSAKSGHRRRVGRIASSR